MNLNKLKKLSGDASFRNFYRGKNSIFIYCIKNKKRSKLLNVTKTKKIISYFIKKNIYFIFFSTEFVFDGNKGDYTELSKTNPINLYGKQKLMIEKLLLFLIQIVF